MRKLTILIVLVLGIVAAGCSQAVDQPTPEINSFEECVAAGYPVLESYPEQCKTPDGRTLVREASTQLTELEWKIDDVILKRDPESGELACFGCGAVICKDPIAGLEKVEETPEQHCNQQLEIVSSAE